MPFLFLVFFAFAGLASAPLQAQDKKLVILVPGGEGAPQPVGFLMRNRGKFNSAGFETVISTTGRSTARLAREARGKGRKVYIVGMSIGVIKSSAALGRGAPADAAVFFSGNFERARVLLGNPGNLPPTLVVHHRKDECPGTAPRNVEDFKSWSRGRVERVVWINSTGKKGPPCGPVGAHGFFRKDAEPVNAAISFIRSH